jgi:transcriptional repressor NF-X1
MNDDRAESASSSVSTTTTTNTTNTAAPAASSHDVTNGKVAPQRNNNNNQNNARRNNKNKANGKVHAINNNKNNNNSNNINNNKNNNGSTSFVAAKLDATAPAFVPGAMVRSNDVANSNNDVISVAASSSGATGAAGRGKKPAFRPDSQVAPRQPNRAPKRNNANNSNGSNNNNNSSSNSNNNNNTQQKNGAAGGARRNNNKKGPQKKKLAASISSLDDNDVDAEAVGALQAKGYSALSAQIMSKLQRDAYECLVCMDRVQRHHRVWCCSQCYALFHIACISKWSKRGALLPPGAAQPPPQQPQQWRCPACQDARFDQPKASCFCGLNAGDPVDDGGFLVPHSCGEPCGRKRLGDARSGCDHPCPQLCHPGPCAPCAALGPLRSCWCGATDFRVRCADDRSLAGQSCGGVCGRKLGCGEHRCQQLCHAGECAPCNVQDWSRCYCGGAVRALPCGAGITADAHVRNDKRADAALPADTAAVAGQVLPRAFACDAPCDDLLDCGQHRCLELCHSGACKPCALSPQLVTHCPCGKVRLGVAADGAAPAADSPPSISLCERTRRTSCKDAIPTCGQTCDKLMSCGVHRCRRACHSGACGDCEAPMATTCRCTKMTATRPCKMVLGEAAAAAPLLCEARCNEMRECGRHKCGAKCCTAAISGDPDGMHVCRIVCEKKLTCQKHTCKYVCHRGRCPPCMQASFDEWSCPCGGTVVLPPISCGTVMPMCNLPCRRQRACGHVDSIAHPCHEGPCPPCVALTRRECVGGHGVALTLPCHTVNALCGGFCKKQLVCHQHRCTRRCHAGPCDPATEQAAASLGALEERPSCGGVCNTVRASCGHGCLAQCHPGSPCPDVPCQQNATISCACGRRSITRVCKRTSESVAATAAVAVPTVVPADESVPPSETEASTAAAATTSAPEGEAVVAQQVDTDDLLACDDKCRAEQRREQLANAFGVGGRDGSKAPLYSDLLYHFALASPVFVRMVERTFHHVATSNAVPIGGTYRLPPMDKMRRQIVHQLAKHYFLQTESVGEDPFRRVVLTRCADTRLPTQSLGRVAYPQVPNAVGLSALHFAGLTPNVRTNHLEALLRPFKDQYRLKWLDDSNALAIFVNDSEARVALRTIKPDSPFEVTLFDDLQPTAYGVLALSIDKDATDSNVQRSASELRKTSNSPPPASVDKAPQRLTSGWVEVAKPKSKTHSKPSGPVSPLETRRAGLADAAFDGDE